MSTIWIAASCVGFLVAGAWAYAKCTHAERKAGREAIDAKLREQHRQAEEGRRRNEEALRRKEVIEVLDWILRDPEVLRNRNYPSHMRETSAPALYELASSVRALSSLSHRVANTAEAQQATAKALREVRATQQDIMKALQLGQPVE